MLRRLCLVAAVVLALLTLRTMNNAHDNGFSLVDVILLGVPGIFLTWLAAAFSLRPTPGRRLAALVAGAGAFAAVEQLAGIIFETHHNQTVTWQQWVYVFASSTVAAAGLDSA